MPLHRLGIFVCIIETLSQRFLSVGVSLLGGFAVLFGCLQRPLSCLRIIFWHAPPQMIAITKLVLRISIALFRGLLVPHHGFGVVLRDALPVLITHQNCIPPPRS